MILWRNKETSHCGLVYRGSMSWRHSSCSTTLCHHLNDGSCGQLRGRSMWALNISTPATLWDCSGSFIIHTANIFPSARRCCTYLECVLVWREIVSDVLLLPKVLVGWLGNYLHRWKLLDAKWTFWLSGVRVRVDVKGEKKPGQVHLGMFNPNCKHFS